VGFRWFVVNGSALADGDNLSWRASILYRTRVICPHGQGVETVPANLRGYVSPQWRQSEIFLAVAKPTRWPGRCSRLNAKFGAG
jgi:hypothetical protein